MKTIYKSKGLVYGSYWGGGEGSFEAEKYQASTMAKLEKMINNDIKDGSIDSGMGYEAVLGAMIEIKTVTTITKDGKDFKNETYEIKTFGNLSEEQIDFLDSIF